MLFKEYMKQNRYNYSTLAEALGVNRITVNNWDKGTTSPTLKQFSQLCDLLECEPLDLLNNYIEMKKGKKINEKVSAEKQ